MSAVTHQMTSRPATRPHVERSPFLLSCGAVAGPVYVTVAAVQAVTRDGFDIRYHAVSLLSNGDLGWIQIVNFLVTGLLTIAGAVGLRLAMRGHAGGTWAPRLIGIYGVSLLGAGIFVADPMAGFPADAPTVRGGMMSASALGHMVAGGVGFIALIAACFVIARAALHAGRRGWAVASITTGVAFWAAFAGIASGAQPARNLVFTAAVVIMWAWLTRLMATAR